MSKSSIAQEAADAKKTADEKAASDKTEAGPEIETDEVQSIEPSETEKVQGDVIETVEDLEIAFPSLVSAVRDEVIKQISKCSLAQIKENMPAFYKRLALEVQAQGGPNLNIPGFLLELDDPFAIGALRTYQKLTGSSELRLPFVLPNKDKRTRAALESYIVRASGGGDVKRAEAASRAMKNVK